MVITDISPQVKNPLRVNIFVDGAFAFGLSKDLLFTSKLSINDVISQQTIDDLIEKDQIELLMNKALRFLSFRERSEKEICDYFYRKAKVDLHEDSMEKSKYASSVDKVIDKLKEWDQVDDYRFAKWWVEQRSKFRPKGPQVLRLELSKKGISKEIIEKVLTSFDSSSSTDLAIKASLKKHQQLEKLPFPEYKQKLAAYLARRGFDWETIRTVIDTLRSKK